MADHGVVSPPSASAASPAGVVVVVDGDGDEKVATGRA